MIEVAIMIEGQNGLNWPRWQRIARAVEDLGYAGLFRSDHFTNAGPPDKDSLECWVSLAWLASHTRRIQFGWAPTSRWTGRSAPLGLARGDYRATFRAVDLAGNPSPSIEATISVR